MKSFITGWMNFYRDCINVFDSLNRMIYHLIKELIIKSNDKNMKQKSKLIIIIAVFGFNIAHLQGQETIAASAGNVIGSGGSVSYTIGQVAFSILSGTNGSVVQGVQQPYEISVITAVENTEETTLDCIVYPNPTRNTIKLSIESPDFDNMCYRLFDINGILIQDMKVESEETEISMDNLVPSIYFLRVIKNKKDLKTFKIIKN